MVISDVMVRVKRIFQWWQSCTDSTHLKEGDGRWALDRILCERALGEVWKPSAAPWHWAESRYDAVGYHVRSMQSRRIGMSRTMGCERAERKEHR